MTFGEKIARLRKEQNYTQEQLAQLLSVSRQSVSKWESDLAFPETEKLLRIAALFDCSLDYLLKEETEQKNTPQTAPEQQSMWSICSRSLLKERKSEKTVFGMPLYHIGKNAKGFVAVGIRASGVISVGLLSKGILSLGLLSLGVCSFGLLSLGLLAVGCLAFGLLALGSVAVGLIAAGAVAIGVVSFGAASIGCFSAGALAIGKYIAVGDEAHALIAVGKTASFGEIHSHIGTLADADLQEIGILLNAKTPIWLLWAKDFFAFLTGI